MAHTPRNFGKGDKKPRKIFFGGGGVGVVWKPFSFLCWGMKTLGTLKDLQPCKVDVHWFNKLFGPIRTDRTFQARKWLEICKCQRMITPYQCSTISLAGNKLVQFMSRFPYCWETLYLYFEKYGCTSALLVEFRINMGKYRRAGRSV